MWSLSPLASAFQQARPDGMDVLHAAMQQMNMATASLGIAGRNDNVSSGMPGTDGDAEDVSSSQEVTPRSSMDEPGGPMSPEIDPDPLEVGKALARPKARIITPISSQTHAHHTHLFHNNFPTPPPQATTHFLHNT